MLSMQTVVLSLGLRESLTPHAASLSERLCEVPGWLGEAVSPGLPAQKPGQRGRTGSLADGLHGDGQRPSDARRARGSLTRWDRGAICPHYFPHLSQVVR